MGMLGKLSIKGHKEGVDIVRVVVGHGVKHPNTAERHIVWMELTGSRGITIKEGISMDLKENDVVVPLDVPEAVREDYIKNYLTITRNSGRLMMFAGDQKVEHLNNDFYGEGIHRMTEIPEQPIQDCKSG